MKPLRNYGIYELRGVKRRLIHISAAESTFLLFDLKLRNAIPARFEITSDGRIINWHKEETGWTVDDLIDTGETSLP